MKLVSTLVYELPEVAAARLRWAPPLCARIAVGYVFLMTGWAKLHALDQIAAYFRSLGIPYPELQAPFVASVELVCGTMILVGLCTRLAAIPLIATMAVATSTAQWPNVSSLSGLLGLVEVLYVVSFLWLAIDGPGPISLDALVRPLLAGERVEEGEERRAHGHLAANS